MTERQRAHEASEPPMLRAEGGFSVLEAIVILLISGMVLSVVLPIVIQSTAQNIRTGKRALAGIEQAFDENTFRRIIGSTIPPRQSDIGQPARVTLEGDSSSLSFVSKSTVAVGCIVGSGEAPARLSIEIDRATGGAKLMCYSGSASRTLLNLSTSEARFAYSSDGQLWSDHWPRDVERKEWARQLTGLGEAQGAPLVSAPLVRFEFKATNQQHAIWVERAGAVEPVAYDLEGLFMGDARPPEERF